MSNDINLFRVWEDEVFHDDFCAIDVHGETLDTERGEWDYTLKGGVVQYFIGLTDTTNRPIYVGDIVSYKAGYSDSPEDSVMLTGVVAFFPKSAAYGLMSVEDYVAGKEPDAVTGDLFAFSSSITEYRVVGNIFENPELLEPNDE